MFLSVLYEYSSMVRAAFVLPRLDEDSGAWLTSGVSSLPVNIRFTCKTGCMILSAFRPGVENPLCRLFTRGGSRDFGVCGAFLRNTRVKLTGQL